MKLFSLQVRTRGAYFDVFWSGTRCDRFSSGAVSHGIIAIFLVREHITMSGRRLVSATSVGNCRGSLLDRNQNPSSMPETRSPASCRLVRRRADGKDPRVPSGIKRDVTLPFCSSLHRFLRGICRPKVEQALPDNGIHTVVTPRVPTELKCT